MILIGLILFALGSVLLRRIEGDSFLTANATDGLGGLKSLGAPDFQLALFDGSSLRMSELRGRGVVVNFWSSWCVPCQREMPLLTRTAKEVEANSVTFLGVALWDARSDALSFHDRYGAGYPTGPDETGKIAIDFGVAGLPETFFVRPDGTLSRRWIGELHEAQLRRFIDEIRA